MPSGFYWGGLAQGLGQGMQDIAKLQQEQELTKLKQKMINATLEHTQAQTQALMNQADQQRQNNLTAENYGILRSGGTPAHDDPNLQMSIEAQRGPKALTPADMVTQSILRSGKGYSGIASAQQALQTPEEKAAAMKQQMDQVNSILGGGAGENTHQVGVTVGPHGTTTRINPRPEHGLANEAALRVLRAGGTLPDAIAAANQVISSGAENRSFYNIQGAVNAQQGMPLGTPLVGGQPPTQGSYPNPRIGSMTVDELFRLPGEGGQPPPSPQPNQPSRFMQNQRDKAAAAKTGAINAEESGPVPLGKEKDMARLDANGNVEMAPANATPQQLREGGFRTVEQPVLQSLQALAPARQALAQFKANAGILAKQSEGLGGTTSAIVGTLPGVAGAIGQRFGASNAGDNMEAATLNFMQHYDRVVGGLRGASSPQLLEIMRQRAPRAGMTPQQIQNRTTYIENVFHAMEGELKAVVGGQQPHPEAISKAIISNPDQQTGPGFKDEVINGRTIRTYDDGRVFEVRKK